MVANGFEGVGWMVGGGAKHSANIGRVLAYAATGGSEGIVGPTDCKVSPSSTPNNQVHVSTGAVAIRNRYANALNETYVARATQVSDVTVGSAGSSGRSDLIIVRMKDPQYGAAAPASVADGPYVFPEVIPGVAANTTSFRQLGLNYPAYALARIDLPANASSVTAGMIKNLRKLATPHFIPFNDLQRGPATEEVMAIGDTAWRNWPSNSTSVEVPEWATHAEVSIELLSYLADGPANVDTRINFGGLIGPSYYIDYNGADPTFQTFATEALQHSTYASFDVTSLAGQTVTLRLNGMRTFPNEAKGRILCGPGTQVRFRVEFFERPI